MQSLLLSAQGFPKLLVSPSACSHDAVRRDHMGQVPDPWPGTFPVHLFYRLTLASVLVWGKESSSANE